VLVLAFDTATAVVTTALCEWRPGEGSHVRAATHTSDRRHAEYLAPSIMGVLAEGGASPGDLSVIVVGVGPGPYTGLRVGLATAHAMGETLGIPVHGVCTLDALAFASQREKPFVVATDARRKEVYWARYDSYRSRVSGPEVGPPSEAAEPGLPVLGEGVALYPAVLGDRAGLGEAGLGDSAGLGEAGLGDSAVLGDSAGLEVEPRSPSAAAMAELAVRRLNGEPGLPLLPAEPLYLRRPDAREPGPRKKVSQR
jgi:tRNA threonylcarbamoyladenosine biosynthesis protein TsaB